MIATNSRYLVSRSFRCLSTRSLPPRCSCSQLPRRLVPPTAFNLRTGDKSFHTSRPYFSSIADSTPTAIKLDPALLPVSCPGCGAFTQWIDPKEAGYYTTTRRAVKAYIRSGLQDQTAKTAENEVETKDAGAGYENKHVTVFESEQFRKQEPTEAESQESAPSLPLCDRCHSLVNHNEAQPIPYPPLSYIRDIMEESPWKTNHVYHILDAADFPLSLIPNIHRDLSLKPQRSANRRADTVSFRAGKRQADLHFIITRSDLLGGVKEHVDSLMTYMTEVLRDAFGSSGDKVRLGNVHMVSAYRGWWTKEIKNKIWNEGGGVWMVGKTNVGKSNLISAVFPKSPEAARRLREDAEDNNSVVSDMVDLTADSLLPPVQKQHDFPVLPIVSACPGTTASPIRIPFGEKKGEVIDLPGLFRGGVAEYVQDKHKLDLIMTKRPKPERLTIKPGQSLLLGGLIRITPVDPQDVILASPFVPLEPHITSTAKAVEMMSGERTAPYTVIANEGVGETIASAGAIELKYDVTKTYGRRIREPSPADDGRISLFQVLSVDLLIEGCGWVELITQVRTRNLAQNGFPKIEVFSPEGKCVGSRQPMTAYASLHEKRRKDAKKAGRRRRFN